MVTIEISEDLRRAPGDPDRFCATTTDPETYDMGGFGATEQAALRDLAGQVGLSDEQIATATYVRMATR